MSIDLLTQSRATYDRELETWISKEKAAVDLIAAVGHLLFNQSVELVFFRNQLLDTHVSELLQFHQYSAEVVKKPVDIFTTAKLANILKNMDLVPSKIDIGKLAAEWIEEEDNHNNESDFLLNKLSAFIGQSESRQTEPRDVVLFGFGRIGRLCARELIEQFGKGNQLRLKAIVTRKVTDAEVQKRGDLLRMDSVHGPFNGTVSIDIPNRSLTVNGQIIKLIEAPSPEEVDYEAHGITNAILIDNTGAFRDRTALSRHLKAKGISKVILTAPGKEVPNIVYGVNHQELNLDEENVYSAASCTTNAISTVLSVIEKAYGVEKGHIETVHAYTNDQNLLDNFHKAYRRGRSAAVNMVITETGAAKAVTKVIPSLANKLTANAVRVPVPNGSLAIMHLTLGKEVTREGVNEALRHAALNGSLVDQIKYSIENELVSSDIIGDSCCSVFDSQATIVGPDGKNVVLYVWYDNEYGYTRQVIRLAKHVAKVRRMIYY